MDVSHDERIAGLFLLFVSRHSFCLNIFLAQPHDFALLVMFNDPIIF
jgi:hypothetical protein